MEKDEYIINFDMQGWPEYKETLRYILESLKAKVYKTTDNKEVIGFEIDDKLLDICPRTLEDDGMGYGINEKYIISTEGNTKEDFINFFIEKPLEPEELKKELEFINRLD